MDQTAPTADTLHEIAAATVRAFPAPFASLAQDVVLQVVDFAPADFLADTDFDPWDLTGLYDGISLTEKSSADQPGAPDTVWLFRRPILDEWADRGNVTLKALVAHITVHEFAHHFGWSDADIAQIDRWWT